MTHEALDRDRAVERLLEVAALSNTDLMLAHHLRAAAACVSEENEEYMSNGQYKALQRLARL